MRLRHIPEAAGFVAEHTLALDEAQSLAQRGQWRQLFFAGDELVLEIGCGRGRFIIDSAEAMPSVCFLGLELREEMIMQALQRRAQPPDNVRFLHVNAGLLPELFVPGEIDRICLNFPDPWPKTAHAKRRLTAPWFVEQYLSVLRPGGELVFKTDNRQLFVWSRHNFAIDGWAELECSFDLPAEQSGVMTEYERRYRFHGKPIYFLRMQRRL